MVIIWAPKAASSYKLVAPLGEVMGEAYPELLSMQEEITNTLKKEEEQFARTLDKGMGVLEAALVEVSGDVLPGELIFQLYDTFGFPTDLTNDVAREKGYSLDMDGYEKCMEEQRNRARSASQFGIDYTDSIRVDGSTEFCGYSSLENTAKVIGLYAAGEEVESAAEDTEVVVVLDSTPFYAESGGQVGDSGYLQTASGKIEIAIAVNRVITICIWVVSCQVRLKRLRLSLQWSMPPCVALQP